MQSQLRSAPARSADGRVLPWPIAAGSPSSAPHLGATDCLATTWATRSPAPPKQPRLDGCRLEKRNPLPNGADKDIKFNKDAHKYTVKTSGFDLPVEMSVTELLKEHFEDFDPWRKAANGVEKGKGRDALEPPPCPVPSAARQAEQRGRRQGDGGVLVGDRPGGVGCGNGDARYSKTLSTGDGGGGGGCGDRGHQARASRRAGCHVPRLSRSYYPEFELKPWRSELRIFMRHPTTPCP